MGPCNWLHEIKQGWKEGVELGLQREQAQHDRRSSRRHHSSRHSRSSYYKGRAEEARYHAAQSREEANQSRNAANHYRTQYANEHYSRGVDNRQAAYNAQNAYNQGIDYGYSYADQAHHQRSAEQEQRHLTDLQSQERHHHEQSKQYYEKGYYDGYGQKSEGPGSSYGYGDRSQDQYGQDGQWHGFVEREEY